MEGNGVFNIADRGLVHVHRHRARFHVLRAETPQHSQARAYHGHGSNIHAEVLRKDGDNLFSSLRSKGVTEILAERIWTLHR